MLRFPQLHHSHPSAFLGPSACQIVVVIKIYVQKNMSKRQECANGSIRIHIFYTKKYIQNSFINNFLY